MKKKVKILTILSIIISLIILLIVGIVIFYHNTTPNEDNKRTVSIDELYGSWISQYIEIYENDKLIDKRDNITDKNIIFTDNKKVEICFINEADCYIVDFKYKDDKLIVEDNITFLSGTFEVKMQDNYLITIASMGDNKTSYLYYQKSDARYGSIK